MPVEHDRDPYPNTVTVETHPTRVHQGTIDKSDTDSVNLFRRSIAIDEEYVTSPRSVTGSTCTAIDISNTSSADTPNLVIDKISDTVQGDLTQAANVDSSTLAPRRLRAACKITYH